MILIKNTKVADNGYKVADNGDKVADNTLVEVADVARLLHYSATCKRQQKDFTIMRVMATRRIADNVGALRAPRYRQPCGLP